MWAQNYQFNFLILKLISLSVIPRVTFSNSHSILFLHALCLITLPLANIAVVIWIFEKAVFNFSSISPSLHLSSLPLRKKNTLPLAPLSRLCYYYHPHHQVCACCSRSSALSWWWYMMEKAIHLKIRGTKPGAIMRGPAQAWHAQQWTSPPK